MDFCSVIINFGLIGFRRAKASEREQEKKKKRISKLDYQNGVKESEPNIWPGNRGNVWLRGNEFDFENCSKAPDASLPAQPEQFQQELLSGRRTAAIGFHLPFRRKEIVASQLTCSTVRPTLDPAHPAIAPRTFAPPARSRSAGRSPDHDRPPENCP